MVLSHLQSASILFRTGTRNVRLIGQSLQRFQLGDSDKADFVDDCIAVDRCFNERGSRLDKVTKSGPGLTHPGPAGVLSSVAPTTLQPSYLPLRPTEVPLELQSLPPLMKSRRSQLPQADGGTPLLAVFEGRRDTEA